MSRESASRQAELQKGSLQTKVIARDLCAREHRMAS